MKLAANKAVQVMLPLRLIDEKELKKTESSRNHRRKKKEKKKRTGHSLTPQPVGTAENPGNQASVPKRKNTPAI